LRFQAFNVATSLSPCPSFLPPKPLRDESQDERIQGDTLRLGARRELCMQRLGDTGNKFAGRHATAIWRRHGKPLALQRSKRCFQCIFAVLQRLFDGLSVGNTFSEIRV